MGTDSLIARARKSYRSLDGVVVVSPKLIAELAHALECLLSDSKVEETRLKFFIEKQALEIRRLRLTDGTFKC